MFLTSAPMPKEYFSAPGLMPSFSSIKRDFALANLFANSSWNDLSAVFT